MSTYTENSRAARLATVIGSGLRQLGGATRLLVRWLQPDAVNATSEPSHHGGDVQPHDSPINAAGLPDELPAQHLFFLDLTIGR